MKAPFGLLVLAAVPLYGGTVDLTGAETVLVRTGDTLSFDLFTGSYSANAQALGLSANPEAIAFCLITSPLAIPGQFVATITSSDASIELAFGGVSRFNTGYLSSAGFQGIVSTLNGHLNLTSSVSSELFSGGALRLNLRNQGPDLLLGLPPLTLSQDLFVTLSGGPLSVGAHAQSVTLQRPDSPLLLAGRFNSDISDVPEPGSACFFEWRRVGLRDFRDVPHFSRPELKSIPGEIKCLQSAK